MRGMEKFIDKENAVRFVHAFVEQLELQKLSKDFPNLFEYWQYEGFRP